MVLTNLSAYAFRFGERGGSRKTPLTFELKQLRLSSAGKGTTTVFHAEVVKSCTTAWPDSK